MNDVTQLKVTDSAMVTHSSPTDDGDRMRHRPWVLLDVNWGDESLLAVNNRGLIDRLLRSLSFPTVLNETGEAKVLIRARLFIAAKALGDNKAL